VTPQADDVEHQPVSVAIERPDGRAGVRIPDMGRVSPKLTNIS
jgi:hypothetical protein